MKNLNKNFYFKFNIFFQYMIKKYFNEIDLRYKKKILLHLIKAHKLVIFYVYVIFFISNVYSLVFFRKKIKYLKISELEKILNFLEKIKFLEIHKFLDLFHAICTIHIDSNEKIKKIVHKNKFDENFIENIVIGSGPAGSITANEILKKNIDVLIIEKGNWVEHFKLKHPGSELMSKWTNGGLTGALGNVKIQYASANCFGGGSEINSGLYHEADKNFLEEWSKKFNTKSLNKVELDKYFQSTKKETNVIYQNNIDELSKLILDGSKKNNWKIEEIPRWVSYNENILQKKSMTKTYLKDYLDKNGKIMLNTYAENIKKSKNYWLLTLKRQNKKKIIKCKNLFLCCGSIENIFLLKKSGLIKKESEIFFHPMIKVIGRFPKKINYKNSEISTQQITQFFPKFILGNAASGLQFLKISSLNDQNLYKKIKDDWEFMSIFHATFSLGKGTVYNFPFIKDPLVSYEINNKEIDNIKDGLDKLCKLLFDSGCEYVFPIIKESSILYKNNYTTFIDKIKNIKQFNFSSVHILGGFPMGEDEKCLVNSYGKFFSEKNLYINDSSLICNKLVKNPQGTVMAIALRNVKNFLKNYAINENN